ncbi:sensor histidine kinase [Corynebacterium ulcerans]|uniref:sensor histidine kinase n=1 Tax=Corynebacterium ulcerans TaxID=65058 RepID=UPI000DA38218|nr:histidine kinase [Corynebacterium ulcerans]MBH5297606.1 two-component sensor histidine kinase [Corynebacterium ulcerans]SQG56877.1 histidine kinase [Corynebacterium ulcerans]
MHQKIGNVDKLAAALAALLSSVYVVDFITTPTPLSAVLMACALAFIPALLFLHRNVPWMAALNLGILGVWALVCLIAFPANLGVPPQLIVAPWVIFSAARTESSLVVRNIFIACLAGSLLSPAMWKVADIGRVEYRGLIDAPLILLVHWLIALTALLLGRAVKSRKEAQLAQVMRERERERTLIAAEIHDVLAHSLTLIRMQAAAGISVPSTANDALTTIHSVAGEGIAEVRSIIHALGSNGISAPESANLDDLFQRFREQGLEITASVADLSTTSPITQLAAYRIITESLTNALKHQRPPISADVTASTDPRGISITCTTHGDSASTSTHGGFGLVGLSERCAALGGTLTHNFAHKHATITAWLPKEQP